MYERTQRHPAEDLANGSSSKEVLLSSQFPDGVTASVTKEIREGRESGNAALVVGEGDRDEPPVDRTDDQQAKPNRTTDQQAKPDQVGSSQEINQTSHREMTQEVKGKQISATAPTDQLGHSILTGKLCKRALALIRWQCGADTAVDDRMVQALTGWLRKRGISIYTEAV
jgi:hypothetical protein